MARKYDLISELYSRVSREVVSSSENWMSFLKSACRNYRLRFDEQLLVFAQRPDATAVLEIERWNGTFGRWVNRGAHGIAVFEDADRSRQRLLHYFDISDTHESRFARPVPIWGMKPEYTDEVIETLENTFGELEDKSTLPAAIFSAAKNAAEDNLADYLSDFNSIGEGTDLVYLSEEEAISLYTGLVQDSIAYMLMSRLGLETERFFTPDQFDGILSFGSAEAVNAVGIATSDIAEMGLSEISKTITALDRQNRIIDESTIREYNKAENKERSENHEQDRVHDAGRLQPSEPDTSRTAGSRVRALRTEAQDLPEGTPQNHVLQPSDELQADGAFVGGAEPGDRTGEHLDSPDGEERGLDRGTQGERYDDLGSPDEQPEEPGSGDRYVRGDLRLDYYDRSHEDRSLPFFGSDADINEILLTTPYLKDSKDVIRSYYETHRDREDQEAYIKGIFNNDYTELILSDGRRVGYKTYQNVLHLWEGSYLSRTKQAYYDWGVIAAHFEALRLLGELHDVIKPLPSLEGQLSLIETQAEPKSSAFTFTQEIIDAVLTRGSGFDEGKMRIYEQFQKSLSSADNIAFLKREYGWGGSYPAIVGAGIDEQHDGKGIKLSRRSRGGESSVLLKWTQVESRIVELIRQDRYLNPKEQERYPAWLEAQEARCAELAQERANREIISTPPSPAVSEQPEKEYVYHLGDSVFIGADEYEILSFDKERVMLYDTKFPLINKEMSRSEFDNKVRENPMNDHLLAPAAAQPETEKADADSATPVNTQSDVMQTAQQLINEFCQSEYEEDADFSNLREIGVAYTTVGDDDLETQVNVNLEDFSVDRFVAGVLVESRKYGTLEELIEKELEGLDFNDLTEYTDDQLESVREKLNPTQSIEPQAPVTPAWEKQPKNKVKTFDLHPEIPMSERHTFDLAANEIEEVGKKERFRRNLMAIQLLKKCQAENRFTTHKKEQI